MRPVLGNNGYSVQYDPYRFLRQSGSSWQDAVAFAMTSVNLSQQGAQAQAITAGVVSSNYFQFLGIRPQSGRFFQPIRTTTLMEQVMRSPSDALWRDRFNADHRSWGARSLSTSHSFTVAASPGRISPEFFGGVAEAAWIPLSGLRDLSADSGGRSLLHYGLQVAVRLRPGARDTAAAARVHTLALPLSCSIPAATWADGI